MPDSNTKLAWLLPLALLLVGGACKKDQAQADSAEVPAIELAQAKPAADVKPTEHPLLWRIAPADGKGPASYLFGTIHIPDDRVLALPAVVTKAIDGCAALYTEIPMDMATQISLSPRMMLPGDETLDTILPEKLYARLAKLFKDKDLPLAPLSKMKIWAIATQVVMLDHIMEFASKQPLDMVIYKRAQQAGKKVGGLETVEEQISVFDDLTQAEQIRMLEQTLDLIDEYKAKGKDAIDELIQAYLSGQDKKLLDAMMESYDPNNELDRKVMKRLFTDRNERMSERIAKKLSASPGKSIFFAVGAGHLVGDQGLVALLREAGYQIERVKP